MENEEIKESVCEICDGDGWIWKTEDEKEDCICQKKVIDPNDQYDNEKEREDI